MTFSFKTLESFFLIRVPFKPEFVLANLHFRASLVAQRLKHLLAMLETWVRSLGWEDSPGEGNGNPLLYSCLENPMDGGTWWATVHGVARMGT